MTLPFLNITDGQTGETCAIEALIKGNATSGGLDGYKAQAGAGKSYRNNDLESITVL